MNNMNSYYDFEENFKSFLPTLEKLIKEIRSDLDSRTVSDYVNLMLMRNDFVALYNYSKSAIALLPLVVGSKNHDKHEMMIECTKPIFDELKADMIYLFNIKDETNFYLEVSAEAAKVVAALTGSVYDFFDVAGCWKAFEE